jgi:hypothetical protein
VQLRRSPPPATCQDVARRQLDPRIAIVYRRTSTGRQDLSPEAQTAACEAFAAREGITIIETHTDVASGAAPLSRRPGPAPCSSPDGERPGP